MSGGHRAQYHERRSAAGSGREVVARAVSLGRSRWILEDVKGVRFVTSAVGILSSAPHLGPSCSEPSRSHLTSSSIACSARCFRVFLRTAYWHQAHADIRLMRPSSVLRPSLCGCNSTLLFVHVRYISFDRVRPDSLVSFVSPQRLPRLTSLRLDSLLIIHFLLLVAPYPLCSTLPS